MFYLKCINFIWSFQIAIASVLYDHGLLMTSEPLDPIDDDESSDAADNC